MNNMGNKAFFGLALLIATVSANMPAPRDPMEPVYTVGALALLLIMNALVEGGVAYFFLGAKKERRFLYSILGVNAVSWPLSWFAIHPLVVQPYFGASSVFGVIATEIIVVALEAIALYCLNRKLLDARKALIYSFAMNAASIVAFVLIGFILTAIGSFIR